MDCYARVENAHLILGNAHMERRWRLDQGRLYATSFLVKASARQWCAKPAAQPSFWPASSPLGPAATVSLTTQTARQNPTQASSLLATLTAASPTGTIVYHFQIFPALCGLTVQVETQRVTPPTAAATAQNPAESSLAPSGIEAPLPQTAAAPELTDTLDALEIDPLHLDLTQVTLRDQTDGHDNLVFENTWLLSPAERTLELPGNVFFLQHRLTGDGLIWLKHGPLPYARPVKNPADLHLTQSRCHFLGHNAADDGSGAYPSSLLAYSSGRPGRIAALHALQRQFREFNPERDGRFLSNTWGDRSKDGRLSEEFMQHEITFGEKLGVEVVQIDDGWQRGVTANSVEKGGVWESYWDFNPDFWRHHPLRFPHDITSTVQLAQSKGMAFGLWFGPDSGGDFANWEKDAAVILRYHRDYGINYFKIDGVKARTKKGEANLHRFFDAVLEGSQGRVVFDLDITAEIRPGYFGLLHTGPLFLENRYTDWHRYWPHATLRNLWQLSQYVDPVRLRMEFLNHTRNPTYYPNDPLAPATYRPAYLFASVMMSSPLGWFETSNLPPEYIAEVAPLVAIWKEHRAALFTNQTTPIGAAPDGTQWTGFFNADATARSGYVLIFRELNTQPEATLALPISPPASEGSYQVTVLSGSGTIMMIAGQAKVTLPDPQSYLFARWERK